MATVLKVQSYLWIHAWDIMHYNTWKQHSNLSNNTLDRHLMDTLMWHWWQLLQKLPCFVLSQNYVYASSSYLVHCPRNTAIASKFRWTLLILTLPRMSLKRELLLWPLLQALLLCLLLDITLQRSLELLPPPLLSGLLFHSCFTSFNTGIKFLLTK